MLHTFDSRALQFADCYGQRFMKAGTYRYNVLPAGTECLVDKRPYTINVIDKKGSGAMTQHDVVVHAGPHAEYRPEPPELTIEAGDLVLWNCPGARHQSYMVVGDKEFFGSHRLLNESGYTHAFGFAGEYRWRDAYGSAIGGVVRVKDPACRNSQDVCKWRESIGSAALVMITDEKAQPADVEIMTGQTVFFAVTKARGISITDERLLGARGGK